MEKLKDVKILLIDGSRISASEVLDIGSYYYLMTGPNVEEIKKTNVAEIQWRTKEPTNDSSKYIKNNK